MQTSSLIRIALANHEHVMRSALIALLERESDFIVVGDVASGDECIGLVGEIQPDVFVIEAEMPSHDPVMTVRTIHKVHPDTKVLVLSAYNQPEVMVKMIKDGAAGYVLKDDPAGTLVQAIRAVANGLDWVSPRMVEALVGSVKNNGKSHKARLTRREKELLQLMARGLRNGEIAAELALAEKTIKNYASRMYRKLGVTTRVEAILFAINTGLVVLENDGE